MFKCTLSRFVYEYCKYEYHHWIAVKYVVTIVSVCYAYYYLKKEYNSYISCRPSIYLKLLTQWIFNSPALSGYALAVSAQLFISQSEFVMLSQHFNHYTIQESIKLVK